MNETSIAAKIGRFFGLALSVLALWSCLLVVSLPVLAHAAFTRNDFIGSLVLEVTFLASVFIINEMRIRSKNKRSRL